MNTYKNTNIAYHETLLDVYVCPDFRASPRGLGIREKLNYLFQVENPTASPIITSDIERNVKIAEYTAKEMELYNSKSNKAEDFAKASKFWEKIANPDGTINSAYGFLIWNNYSCTSPYSSEAFTPWEWAKQSLISDRDTRQAIMRFSLPEHQWVGNKDQTCTMHGDWLIRNNKLNLSIVMRSNDVVLGLVYDMPWFCSLMDKMLEELKPTYPDLEKGTYTHFVHSLHMYDKDEEIVKKMLGQNK